MLEIIVVMGMVIVSFVAGEHQGGKDATLYMESCTKVQTVEYCAEEYREMSEIDKLCDCINED